MFESTQQGNQLKSSGNKKILIVEDDQFLLEMYSAKLKNAGFVIEIAQDGEQALSKLEEFKPDLVLLDIVIPKLDGFEVLRKIRENPTTKNTKVIALTNLGQQSEVERGMSLGADDYFIKAHFTPSEIVYRINKFFEENKN